jgi:hypothetical protein
VLRPPRPRVRGQTYVLLRKLGGSLSFFARPPNRVPMVQQLGSPPDLPPRHVNLFPTSFAGDVTSEVTAQRARRAQGAKQAQRAKAKQAHAVQPVATLRPLRGVRTHVVRQVAVLEVAGRLGDVVQELDLAVQLALAEEHRGVVCDLSAVLDADPEALELLATAGRHVRDWPGMPVAVASRDARLRAALRGHPLGGDLIVASSLFSAMSGVLATPTLTVASLRLAPHPTSPRAAREFVTRTLLDWRLGRVIPFASLVVSELVASSAVHAGTAIEVSVVWNLDDIRLTVRDCGPAVAVPGQRPSAGVPLRSATPRARTADSAVAGPAAELRGRGLTVVAGLARAFGVLPTAEGGKVVWAVLEAVRPRPSTRRIRTERATPTQESPIFSDACGLADLPFCAGLRPDSQESPEPA